MFEQIARLAIQGLADRFKGAEADRLDLAGLEQRQIRHRNANALGQLGQRHLLSGQFHIEVDTNAHLKVVFGTALTGIGNDRNYVNRNYFIVKRQCFPLARIRPVSNWRTCDGATPTAVTQGGPSRRHERRRNPRQGAGWCWHRVRPGFEILWPLSSASTRGVAGSCRMPLRGAEAARPRPRSGSGLGAQAHGATPWRTDGFQSSASRIRWHQARQQVVLVRPQCIDPLLDLLPVRWIAGVGA